MERRILFISLLPTIALAFALAVGDSEDQSPSRGEVTRIGTTVVEPADVARRQAQMATLADVAP